MASAHNSLWETWHPLAEKALKGEPLSSLNSAYRDGFTLAPLHNAATPNYAGRPVQGGWFIVEICDSDDIAANLATSWTGESTLSLAFAGNPLFAGRGLSADDLSTLDAALTGASLDETFLRLEAGPRGTEALLLFLALLRARNAKPGGFHAGLNPFAAGRQPDEMDLDAAKIAREHGATTILTADGRLVAEAGGTPAQELSFAFSCLTAYLRALDSAGTPLQEAFGAIELALTADQDQFTTIAKLRAARRLHLLIADACGLTTPPPPSIHVTTSARMLASSDPHTNILRNTIAALGAGVGGADSIAVRAFDGAGSPLARRLSRNIETLLLEESHLAALGDPAAGAGAIEALTDEIASRAWAQFQDNEKDAGRRFFEKLTSGTLAAEIDAAAATESAAIASGERTIIGITKYPPPEPTPAETPAPVTPSQRRAQNAQGSADDLIGAAANGATLADLAAALGHEAREALFTPRRLSAPFES